MTYSHTIFIGGFIVALAAISAQADVPAPPGAPSDSPPEAEDAKVSHPGNPSIPPYSHYAVILERRPFGAAGDAMPAAPASTAPTEEEAAMAQQEQAMSKQIDLVAVNVTPRGDTAVGLVEKNGKAPHNYYLKVGESGGGYTVVEADIKEETATIEKDGVTITLKLGKGMLPKEQGTNAPTATASAPAVSKPQPTIQQPPSSLRPGLVRGGTRHPHAGESDKGKSYLELRRERLAAKAAERKAQAEEAARIREEAVKAAKEAAEKREREFNLNLIKKGQRPLTTIELTPEEDAALEKAGVFDKQADQEASPQNAAPPPQGEPPPEEAM